MVAKDLLVPCSDQLRVGTGPPIGRIGIAVPGVRGTPAVMSAGVARSIVKGPSIPEGGRTTSNLSFKDSASPRTRRQNSKSCFSLKYREEGARSRFLRACF
jgi:hypothetical protein